MRFLIGIFLLAMFIGPVGIAQKSGNSYKIQQPRRKTKPVKVGFAGKNPAVKHGNTGIIKKGNISQAGGNNSGKYLKKKSMKIGFVGENPKRKTKKIRYMKSEIKGSGRARSVDLEGKIFKPNKRTDFIAEDRTPQNKTMNIPKTVSDKDMILPKIRGDKKAVELTRQEMKGLDPGVNVNHKNEKRMNDIQYRSAYKFDKKGKANKDHFRKNKER